MCPQEITRFLLELPDRRRKGLTTGAARGGACLLKKIDSLSDALALGTRSWERRMGYHTLRFCAYYLNHIPRVRIQKMELMRWGASLDPTSFLSKWHQVDQSPFVAFRY